MNLPFRALLLTLALPALLATGCSRPPNLVGVDNPEVPVASVPGATHEKMFIMTTREASEVVGALFSAGRAPELGLASVAVSIPPTHVSGDIERPKHLPPDPRTEFAVVDPVIYTGDAAFVSQVNTELMKRPPGQREILLFVHGYNTTTSDAILRLGQFVKDTGFTGVPVLFTWASAAKAPRYVYDLNSALVARSHLKEVADTLMKTRADRVSILAHSMGTFLTMEGLVDAQLSGRLGKRNKIDTVMLASPDIDIDLFRTQVAILPEAFREKIYVLVSQDDYALRVSRIIAGGVPRVGASDAAALEGLGVTVIDLSQIENSSSGSHTKFAGSPEVVQLISKGLNASPDIGGAARTPGLDQLLVNVPIRIFGN